MQTAIAAIFVFLLVILLHELGHFTVAKIVGIKVNEFSIGMGPKIIQTKKGETQYTLRILPIGGYVQMEGEDETSNDPRGFSNAPTLAKIAVVAAGAFMNFILAFIVFSIVAFSIGTATTTIDQISPQSPAYESGLLEGDKIVRINESEITTWNDITDIIGDSSPNEYLNIQVVRNSETKAVQVMPVIEEGRSIIGIMPIYEKSISVAMKSGVENTFLVIRVMFDFISSIFKGEFSTNDLAGPVGVINQIGEVAKMGVLNLLLLLGFISVNLGFFNLLPLPALDGGRIVFLLIELVRGKPMDVEKEGLIHMIGLILLMLLMVFVTYKDLINIF